MHITTAVGFANQLLDSAFDIDEITDSLRLSTLVIVYTICSLLKHLHTVFTVSSCITLNYCSIENNFLNRCLFKFRWSDFVCFVRFRISVVFGVYSTFYRFRLFVIRIFCNSVRLTY